MTQSFDAIIIGAGQAGPSLAGRLTQAGQKVALVERKLFGGTCVNTGCMPTKTMVASAYAANVARRAAEYGVVSRGTVSIDMKRVQARAATVTLNARAGLEKWARSMSGCTVFDGHARFESANTVKVGDQLLTAPRVFINVGGRANVPDMPGVHSVPFLTNTTMMQVDFLPEHLVVVGGSYIGLEFAQMFRRFGSQVTVVEMGARLISREDEDVSLAIAEILQKEDIALRMHAECISLAPHAEGVEVRVSCKQGEPTVVGSHVLLAVGRVPNTSELGLERAGIEVDARGYIKVDDYLQTTVPGVFALGDCNGRGAFTHTAYNDPPLGRVGMTEAQARASGRKLLIGTRPMSKVGRAIEKGETQGFMKVIADAQSKRILGASILGVGGDEAIHGVIDVMNADVPYVKLQQAVPIHPTVSELIPTVLGDMQPVN